MKSEGDHKKHFFSIFNSISPAGVSLTGPAWWWSSRSGAGGTLATVAGYRGKPERASRDRRARLDCWGWTLSCCRADRCTRGSARTGKGSWNACGRSQKARNRQGTVPSPGEERKSIGLRRVRCTPPRWGCKARRSRGSGVLGPVWPPWEGCNTAQRPYPALRIRCPQLEWPRPQLEFYTSHPPSPWWEGRCCRLLHCPAWSFLCFPDLLFPLVDLSCRNQKSTLSFVRSAHWRDRFWRNIFSSWARPSSIQLLTASGQRCWCLWKAENLRAWIRWSNSYYWISAFPYLSFLLFNN